MGCEIIFLSKNSIPMLRLHSTHGISPSHSFLCAFLCVCTDTSPNTQLLARFYCCGFGGGGGSVTGTSRR